MSQSTVSVSLKGQSYEPQPPSFLVRETLNSSLRELASDEETKHDYAWSCLLWSAFLGAYVPSLLPAALTLKAHRYKPVSFGEAVYEHLREQGYVTSEIVDAGLQLAKVNRDSLAPREHEVEEETGNS